MARPPGFDPMFTRAAIGCLGLLMSSGTVSVYGQAVPPRTIQTITIDLASDQRSVRVPFNEHFLMTAPRLEGAKHAVLTGSGRPTWHLPVEFTVRHGDSKTVTFYVPETLPDQQVPARIEYWFHGPPSGPCETPIESITTTPRPAGRSIVRIGSGPFGTTRVVGSQPTGPPCGYFAFTAHPRAPFTSHFDVDVGLIRSAAAGYSGIMVAVHVHPVPLNDNTPRLLRGLGHQVSAFVGLAITELHTERPVLAPISAGVPIAGVGVKVGPTRLIGGAMFFDQIDANPVIDKKRPKYDFIFGASLDFAIKEVLGLVGTALGVK